MTKQLIDQSYEIIERFDFEKVHAYMQLTDWKWCTSNGDMEVPSIEELKSTAEGLLNKLVWEDKNKFVATGGFHAYKFDWGLQLVFSLTHS